jgi:hypothetical protein
MIFAPGLPLRSDSSSIINLIIINNQYFLFTIIYDQSMELAWPLGFGARDSTVASHAVPAAAMNRPSDTSLQKV